MAASTTPVLIAGGLTAANEILFAPMTGGGSPWHDFNWRLVPATAGLALALAGLEKIAPGFAIGIAWLSVAAILIVPVGIAPTPLTNALKIMGYA